MKKLTFTEATSLVLLLSLFMFAYCLFLFQTSLLDSFKLSGGIGLALFFALIPYPKFRRKEAKNQL
jgi:small neutral amino acid transporter SnatA (MarC family)